MQQDKKPQFLDFIFKLLAQFTKCTKTNSHKVLMLWNSSSKTEKRGGILNPAVERKYVQLFFSLLFLAGVIRKNRSSLIMKMAFYGNRETIFRSSDEISVMCLDRRNRRIYFSNGSSIQSIDYFGADTKIILLSSFKLNLQFITQMNILGSYIYMYESQNNVFWRINKIFVQDPEPVFTARSPFIFAVFQGNFEKITCKSTIIWVWFNKPIALTTWKVSVFAVFLVRFSRIRTLFTQWQYVIIVLFSEFIALSRTGSYDWNSGTSSYQNCIIFCFFEPPECEI